MKIKPTLKNLITTLGVSVRRTCFNLIISLLVLITVTGAGRAILAQTQTTGAVRGLVYEVTSRTPIPGAMVTVRNQENGLERSTVTNADGIYFIALLPPGYYVVSGSAQGYVNDPDSMIGNFPIRLSKTNLVEPPPIVLRRIGASVTGAPAPAVAQPGIQNPDSPIE